MTDWQVFFSVVGVILPVGATIAGVSWKIATSLGTLTSKVEDMTQQIARAVYTMEHIDSRQDEQDRRLNRVEATTADHDKRITKLENPPK